MGKPHGQGRYAALRLAIGALRTVQLSILLAVMLVVWCPGAYALDPALDVSQYAHTTWKAREGSSKGGIWSIVQTPDGYLWLGTEFGLLRFDGVRNVPWQPPPNQHLPSNRVWSLLATRDGTLWIGTDKGLASWKDGRLTTYAAFAGQVAFKLLEDREGSVWVGVAAIPKGNLCAIHNGNVQCYGADGSLGDGVYGLYEDSKGNLWAGVRNGLWRWQPGPPKFYPLPGAPDAIRGLGEDDDGALLIVIRGGISRFVDGKIEKYRLRGTMGPFQTEEFLRDRNGSLWIPTVNRGLMHVHQGRTDVYAQSDGLSSDYVTTLFEDREGDIWAGTFGGLDRFRDFAVTTFSVKQGLSNALVTSVLATKDGSVWLGSGLGGLNRWNQGQMTTFGKSRTQARTASFSDKPKGSLKGQSPNSLFQDSSGRIWVSTLRGIGYLENDRFFPISGIPGGRVPSMAEDTRGNLWIANQDDGLFQSFHGKVVQQFSWAKLGHKDPAVVLAADPVQGGLWLGFFAGGVAYFKEGEVRRSYAVGMGQGRVTGLQVEPDGTLWVAAEDGLSRLKNGHVATLTSKNGLPCDMVHGVIEDNDHSTWLYMACGLVRIARSELDAWADAVDSRPDVKGTIQVTVFDSSDGAGSRATIGFYSPQVAKASDGRLWFLPYDGASVLDPRHIPFNKLPPPVHIEQIVANHKSYPVTSDADGNVRLPPLIRDLQIDYTALSFVAPEKVLFRYKLEGWDRDWLDAGTRRQAFYSNLPPRNYRFRVMACNNSGVWNEAGTFLDFSIAPAYYQTWWFRSLCAVGFLALLWSIYQLRVQQLQRQFNIGLEARVNERTRIARELHDTLLQNFHGLMFQFQAASNLMLRRPDEAKRSLDDAIDETKKALAESRDAIQGLRSEPIAKGNLAELLMSTSRELADADGSQHQPVFDLIEEGERRTLSPTVSNDICRIALELMRNAYQHAHARRIEAEIRYGGSMFRLRIRDDGKGIEPKVLKEGGKVGHWGLRGACERADRIGAHLDLWSEPGNGTEVQLLVPNSVAYESYRDSYPAKLVRKVKRGAQSS